jgi:hypothetical protein
VRPIFAAQYFFNQIINVMKLKLTGYLHKLAQRPPGLLLVVGMLVSIFGLALMASPLSRHTNFIGEAPRAESQPAAVQAEKPVKSGEEKAQLSASNDLDVAEVQRKLSMSGFTENKGQLVDQHGNPNTAVRYLLQQQGLNIQLRSTGFSYDTYIPEEVPLTDAEKQRLARRQARKNLSEDDEQTETSPDKGYRLRFHRVDINLVGSNPNPIMEVGNPLSLKENYIKNGVSITDVRQYGTVVYKNVYDNIDLEFVARPGDGKPVEYNFIVHPGGDPAQIQLQYAGPASISLTEGKIQMELFHGVLEENIPASWVDDKSNPVQVNYVQLSEGTFGFEVPAYDQSKTLTIDPTPRMTMGTYLYPDYSYFWSNEYKFDVDPMGNIYLGFSGANDGSNPPVNLATAGAFDTTIDTNNDRDGFVVKLNSKGEILAATYLGDDGVVEFDAFPVVTTDGLFVILEKYDFEDYIDHYEVVKMDANLSAVAWKKNVKANDYVYVESFAVNANGDLVVVAFSEGSTDYPLVPSAPGLLGTYDYELVATKFNKSNGNIIWSKYLGGANDAAYITDIEIDNNGDILMLGMLDVSESFADISDVSTAGAHQTLNDLNPTIDDVMFLIKHAGATGNRVWGTYVGGAGTKQTSNGMFLELDSKGFPWIFYMQRSTDVATTPGAYQDIAVSADFGPSYQNFVQRLSLDGTSVLYSTTYNLPDDDTRLGFAIDKSTDEIYLLLTERDRNYFPEWISDCGLVVDPEQILYNNYYVYLAKFDSTFTRIYGSMIGEFDDTDNKILARNQKLYFHSYASSGVPVTAQGLDYSGPNSAYWLGVFEESFIPSDLTTTPNTITATQEVCGSGLTQSIIGTKMGILAPAEYTNTILYQWQRSLDTLVWTDIDGAVDRNYSPEPEGDGPVYFRRLAYLPGPAELRGGCEPFMLDTSNVHTMIVRKENGSVLFAPTADIAGGSKGFTCVNSEVTLLGSATGGSGTGYTYQWLAGQTEVGTSSTVTHAPSASTIYTLRVTDSKGCFALDQVSINVVPNNAGPDASFCDGTAGVQIGPRPVQGTSLVSYAWSPSDGLSCTNCPQPIANPSSTTDYTLTITVTKPDGTTCEQSDIAKVTFVESPGPNFAGTDPVICREENTTAMLGIPAASGFTYAWTPSTFLSSGTVAEPTFTVPNRLTYVAPIVNYTLRATKSGCNFIDYVQVKTIDPNITASANCGTVWASGTRLNPAGTTYEWEKVSGDGSLIVLDTRLGGADAYVKREGGSSVTYRRKATLEGVTCISNELTLSQCTGGGGPVGCAIIRIDVLDAPGCAALYNGGYRLSAVGVNPSSFNFVWSPAAAFDNPTAAYPRVVSTDPNINITVTATNKFDATDVCSLSMLVNNTSLSLPVFSAPDKTICPGVDSVFIGLPNNPAYSYFWNNGTAMTSGGQTSSNPMLVKLGSSQQYQVLVTETLTGCYSRDTLNVSVIDVRANAGIDQTACAGATVRIGTPVDTTRNWTYLWTPAALWANETNANSPQPEITFRG